MISRMYEAALVPKAPGLSLELSSEKWRDGLLIRSTNWLGDALMTLPAVHQMAGFLPSGRRLDVLCPGFLAPLWEAAPWVSRVIPMRGKRVRSVEARQIRDANAGVAVVLPNSFGAAWDVYLKGIPVRVGRAGRGRGWMLTHRLPEWRRQAGQADRHQLSHYLELAAVFGDVAWEPCCPSLVIANAAEKAVELGIEMNAEERWLVVAPGAAYGPAKQWPAERFADIAVWWRQSIGRVAVVGTDRERVAGEAVRQRVPDVLDLAGKTDLHELMAVLSAADAIVANDSGAMHLGAALGRSGVAIFGSTDPVATGPVGGRWIVLQEPPTCAPCFQRACPRSDSPYECLRRIRVQDVTEALMRLL